ncbi:MAG: nucleotidyltransferase family protein [Fimbriimonadaceae bacterium]|nr:nucleotidyltransferase family protein [Fimbriimonadaceae bacterium]
MSLALGAVILAAGRASRMGGRKLDLPWGDGTVLGATIATAQAAGAAPVVVVLGHQADRLRPVVAAAGAAWVENQRYDDGMLSSVLAGLAALPAGRGAFLLPGDQPLVNAATYQSLAAALEPPWGLLIPTCGGQRGHPLLLAADLFGAVAALDPQVGLRQLRQQQPHRVRLVAVPDHGILTDLDTPADYAAHQPAGQQKRKN